MEWDAETWNRTVFEALRPIDSGAQFNVGLVELDFRGTPGHRPADFPAADLAAFVDLWLDGLDPDDSEASTIRWEGGGVRLVLRARGRSPSLRGWKDMPSFNQLEPKIDDLHLTSGERVRLIDLDRERVGRLASGDMTVVGQGASYQDTFQGLAEEMDHFGWMTVADMPEPVMQTYAAMLGLTIATPGLGNYDAGWRALHRIPSDD
ncbi:MAG: hypothetical protein ACLP1Q_09080 [Solirubrobacteraceae bacterium]